MNDYMQVLRQRFSDNVYREKRRKLDESRGALSEQLSEEQRKLLLSLVDMEALLREQMALDGFIAGFRLATGIARELSMEPPYFFDTEEEDRARKIFEEEQRNGETQGQRRGQHP